MKKQEKTVEYKIKVLEFDSMNSLWTYIGDKNCSMRCGGSPDDFAEYFFKLFGRKPEEVLKFKVNYYIPQTTEETAHWKNTRIYK